MLENIRKYSLQTKEKEKQNTQMEIEISIRNHERSKLILDLQFVFFQKKITFHFNFFAIESI